MWPLREGPAVMTTVLSIFDIKSEKARRLLLLRITFLRKISDQETRKIITKKFSFRNFFRVFFKISLAKYFSYFLIIFTKTKSAGKALFSRKISNRVNNTIFLHIFVLNRGIQFFTNNFFHLAFLLIFFILTSNRLV